MEKLDAIDPNAYTDSKKKRQLLKNMRHLPKIAHLVQNCRDNVMMGFEACAAYLQKNAMLIDYLDKEREDSMKITEKTNLSAMLNVEAKHSSEDMEIDSKLSKQETVMFIKQIVEETSYIYDYNALQSPSLRDSLRIPHDLWRRMEPAMRKKVEDLKDKIIGEKQKPISGCSNEA
jgi:hypothetical protein